MNYSNIEKLDKQIGKIIDQLKQDGLYNNTIIFFFSDHGGPFPRYKRSIYDTGIHCPLIIKWAHQFVGKRNDQLISFIDFAPTILEVTDTKNKFPFELSGGEQQRVAISRAFASRPEIMFADEPTGNLDTKTGSLVTELLFDLNREFGTTLVLVTHDAGLASRCDRTISIASGRVVL